MADDLTLIRKDHRKRGVVVTDAGGNPVVRPFTDSTQVLAGDGTFVTPGGGSGLGDVVGPASAVDDRIATFDGVTGKLIQDGGSTIADVLAAAAAAAPSPGAAFVVLALHASLTSERVLTGTANQVSVTDGGAGGNVTLATPQDIHTGATPRFARLGLGAAADSTAVIKAVGQIWSPLVDDGNSGTTKTIDWDTGNEHYLTLTGNVTLTLSNPKDGGRYVILFNTGAGSFTVTWPSSVKWPAGTGPTITTTASRVDLVTLIYHSGLGVYLGSFNQNYTP